VALVPIGIKYNVYTLTWTTIVLIVLLLACVITIYQRMKTVFEQNKKGVRLSFVNQKNEPIELPNIEQIDNIKKTVKDKVSGNKKTD
jgi:hypothetical protein